MQDDNQVVIQTDPEIFQKFCASEVIQEGVNKGYVRGSNRRYYKAIKVRGICASIYDYMQEENDLIESGRTGIPLTIAEDPFGSAPLDPETDDFSDCYDLSDDDEEEER